MKVAILGGDGFCGWPASLYLSDKGHDVIIIDNLSRRAIDEELGADSLTPIADIDTRIAAWQEVSGETIGFANIDVAQDYDGLLEFINTERPDAIVHFAEQRAAPYSMKNSRNKRYTVDNNINATHNLLAAIVESGQDIHVAHLGTMGVYGYGTAGMKIPGCPGQPARRWPCRSGNPLPFQPWFYLSHDQGVGPASVCLLRQER